MPPIPFRLIVPTGSGEEGQRKELIRVVMAVALRMARERRYPENFTGGERLKIIVKP